MSVLPARGEVWWCELPQVGSRPVVVLSRDAAIPRGLPSEVLLEPGADLVPRPSAVNLDSVESVSVGVLVQRLGRLGSDRMAQICAALDIAVACD